MGTVGSTIYGHCRRFLIRYNAENRAHKFLEKGELPRAPRHDNSKSIKEVTLSRELLEDIHCKDIQLNEYLKKVYLTSTSKIIGTPSKRPKPKKENEVLKKKMFYEPEVASPNHCTLTNIIEILLHFQDDSEKWNVNAIATKYNLKKKDVVALIMSYSLFKIENLDFLNQKEVEEEVKPEKIEFQVYTQLEKKPLRELESK